MREGLTGASGKAHNGPYVFKNIGSVLVSEKQEAHQGRNLTGFQGRVANVYGVIASPTIAALPLKRKEVSPVAGFLALPREVLDVDCRDAWFPGDLPTAMVYAYLVNKANWCDGAAPLPRQRVPLKTGQLVISERDLAKAFEMSRGWIRRRLVRLEILQKMSPVPSPHGTIIEICNYKELFLTNDICTTTSEPTVSPRRAHGEPYQDKKDNTDKKDKEDTLGALPLSVPVERTDPTPYVQFLDTWNKNRGKLAAAQKLTVGRKRKIKSRWTEEPDMDYWARLVQRMATSTFCCQGGWADFDWLVANDTNHLKVGQGKYDNREREEPKGIDWDELMKELT